jgi:hypothetical protein
MKKVNRKGAEDAKFSAQPLRPLRLCGYFSVMACAH